MRPKPQIVHDGPNQFRLAGQKNVSCPGYIPRSNKQGFTWKQVCSCCPRPAAFQYHPSELRAASLVMRIAKGSLVKPQTHPGTKTARRLRHTNGRGPYMPNGTTLQVGETKRLEEFM